jgi:predicted nuclease of predicted toxin-antitoxin system
LKFKLDENLSSSIKQILIASEHDVHTVVDESLQGSSDDNILKICSQETRCLITLDLDFSDIKRFPPENNAGIIILRPAFGLSHKSLTTLVKQLNEALKENSPEKQLWVVEFGRIRMHQQTQEEH